jgi:hypothetical protein
MTFAELEDLAGLAHVDDRGPAGLRAVLERRVEARQAELILRRVVGQGRDGEEVETVEPVHQMADPGDVVRGGPARPPRHRINDVRRRARRRDHRQLAGEGDVQRGVAAAQGNGRRYESAVALDHTCGNAHDLRLVVDPGAVLGEPLPRLLVAHQQPGLLEDLEGSVVDVSHLVVGQVGKKLHRTDLAGVCRAVSLFNHLGSAEACPQTIIPATIYK